MTRPQVNYRKQYKTVENKIRNVLMNKVGEDIKSGDLAERNPRTSSYQR